MSADFWSGYVSGAIGILVGNPLDILKTKLQAAGPRSSATNSSRRGPGEQQQRQKTAWTSLARGSAAPILGYGALNALLFVTYNRSLSLLNPTDQSPSGLTIWSAGALGGFATFLVSAPTELIKCRAQLGTTGPNAAPPSPSSLQVARDIWSTSGLRGLYMGGGITSVRDAVGYGFYFWSYELAKSAFSAREGEAESQNHQALKVLFCGGLAGVVTWASIFPLDVIKTRVQTWDLVPVESKPTAGLPAESAASQPLLRHQTTPIMERPSTFSIATEAYRTEGVTVFFRGLGVCSARAFLVNAIQWAVYEWMMKVLAR